MDFDNFQFQRIKTFTDEKFFFHQKTIKAVPTKSQVDTQAKTNVDEEDDEDQFKSFYNWKRRNITSNIFKLIIFKKY